MSINVTVSGNPVSINRGKMVTACDSAKSEFDKRRLMRLEQVRQQSRDIAETLRNRLRKEKAKCLSEIEKEGEIKLRNWQNKKLLELQNQYQEALDEIGVGHKEAALAEEEDEIYFQQQEINDKIAEERGRAAAERLQVEKNDENLRKAVPIQRKKMTRDVENNRSSVVASSRKTKGRNSVKKKKKKPQHYDSDSENRVPKLFDLDEMDSHSSASLEAEKPRGTVVRKTSKEQQTSEVNMGVSKSDKAAQTQEEIQMGTPRDLPLDTRISDHIKRRARLNTHLDYCDYVNKEVPLSTRCSCCKCLKVPFEEPQHRPQPSESVIRSQQITRENETLYKPPQEAESFERLQLRTSNYQPLRGDDSTIRPQQFGEPVRSQHEPFRVMEGVDRQPPIQESLVKGQQSSQDRPQQFRTRYNPSRVTEAADRQPPVQESVVKVTQPSKETVRSEKLAQKQRKEILAGGAPSAKSGEGRTVPAKPKITLKSSKDRIPLVGSAPRAPVQYYDHPNRYSKQYIPSTSHVEKIDDDQLEISPAVFSDEEVMERMRRRDAEAQMRGQAALEKEKIQREYKELLRKLPALQKQERVYEIGADKEKYHMSRDRLEEFEKRRQNRLDNAYEELFVRRKPATVTLPRRKPDEAAPSLNLANWDVDFEPVASNDRAERLNNLLCNLKAQKDSLLKEIESTLSKEALDELTKGSGDETKSKSTDYPEDKAKRKRSREERPPSPISTDVFGEESETARSKSTKKGTPTSPSPRKKAKLKSKKKVLVRQNSSTQTTPKTGHSAATSPIATAAEEVDKCTCPKEKIDELCEIVIRIKDEEKPEVTVNPPAMVKSVRVIAEERKLVESAEEGADKDKSKGSTVTREESGSKKSTSSKKSGRTSSWRESLIQSQTASSNSNSTSTSYFEPPSRLGLSRNAQKPPSEGDISKTSTLSDGSRRLDPRLLTYIKKLLSMSHASIEELAVSAASDVSTPADSVVDAPTNNPLAQLKNVMRYFNLDYQELQKQLSYVSDEQSPHYNTSESVITSSSTSEGGKSVHFKTPAEVIPLDRKESNDKLLEYAEIAADCTKKISSLTAMIEKVREEKKRILQSPPTSSCSDKDISTTSYLGLPEGKKDEETSSSTTSEELDKKLLTIDYSYAEKLKNLTDEEVQMEKKRRDTSKDLELLDKLKSLLKEGGDKKEESPPLFLDIPKLPRLETPSLDDNDDDNKKKKRPPPSKGLRILGGPVHELSTIIEADSQLSVRAESPPAQETSPKTSSKSSNSVPDILTEVPAHKETSSDDVSEMETMETMLVSIGMEWAIPTLKKTREALALSSSSSSSKKESGELSLREFLSRISSTSTSGTLSDSQGISLIQVDNRRTSTPILEGGGKREGPVFLTDSDLSSVREQSNEASKTG